MTFWIVGSADALLIKRRPENLGWQWRAKCIDSCYEMGRRLPSFNRRGDWLIVAGTEDDDVAALPRVLSATR